MLTLYWHHFSMFPVHFYRTDCIRSYEPIPYQLYHTKGIITRFSLGDRIKCCVPSASVRLSVCLLICSVPTIYSKSESLRNYKFGEDITWTGH